MRLRSVSIENVRALADVTVDLDDTTVPIGEPHTGKRSFLGTLIRAHTTPCLDRPLRGHELAEGRSYLPGHRDRIFECGGIRG